MGGARERVKGQRKPPIARDWPVQYFFNRRVRKSRVQKPEKKARAVK